jgi:hypothetical protein
MTAISRLAPWLAAASACLLVAVVGLRPQGLHFYDPVIQLLALRQWLSGTSTSANLLIRVDPADVTHNVAEWLSWWPPSLQLLAAPMASHGLALGTAVRVIFSTAVITGAIGWALWLRRFALPAAWLCAIVVAFPWLRHASENAFRYSAEILSFACAPWLLLLILRLPALVRLGSARAHAMLTAAGLVLGTAYGVKYSLFVFVFSGLAYVAWETRAGWLAPGRRSRTLAALAVLLAGSAIVPIGLRMLNTAHGSIDPVSSGPRHVFAAFDLLCAVANPALAAADAQGPLFHALVFPGWAMAANVRGAFGDTNPVVWIGLPAGILLWILLWRFWHGEVRTDDPAGRAATVILAVNVVALLVLWQIADVDQNPRHVAPASLAVLPLALREGIRWWRVARTTIRVVLTFAVIAFVVAPLSYGFAYVTLKIHGIAATYRPASSGLLTPTLSAQDSAAVVAAASKYWTTDSVWLVENPEMALELPGRWMLAYGDRSVGRELQRLSRAVWRQPGDLTTSRPIRLLLLLEKGESAAADDGRAAAITGGIAKVPYGWAHVDLGSASCVLWVGELKP